MKAESLLIGCVRNLLARIKEFEIFLAVLRKGITEINRSSCNFCSAMNKGVFFKKKG